MSEAAVFLEHAGILHSLVLNCGTGRLECPLGPAQLQLIDGVLPALVRLQSAQAGSISHDIAETLLVSLGQITAAGIHSAAHLVVDAASFPICAVYAAAAPHSFREGTPGVHPRAFARTTLARTLPCSLAGADALWFAAPLLPLLFGVSLHESVAALRWLCLLRTLRALHHAWGTASTASASAVEPHRDAIRRRRLQPAAEFPADSPPHLGRSCRRHPAQQRIPRRRRLSGARPTCAPRSRVHLRRDRVCLRGFKL
ncbi:MAG TPA: hypothetical protein VME18_09485 [Acidobacteriaceae bacterium]|nr:hypothetical protein [Acidobacteriaceae bacterium]